MAGPIHFRFNTGEDALTLRFNRLILSFLENVH